MIHWLHKKSYKQEKKINSDFVNIVLCSLQVDSFPKTQIEKNSNILQYIVSHPVYRALL